MFLISPPNGLNQWQMVQARGYLTWITRPSPLTYYNSLDGIIGLEYDILKIFCTANNLELRVINAASNNQLFALFDENNIDVAGANLTLIDERANKYLATVDYDETFVSLISSASVPKMKSLQELKNLSGAILNNSSYENLAKDLIEKYQTEIDYLDGKSLYELLQMITDQSIDFTLSDSNIVTIFSAYIPKLRIGEKLSGLHKLVFYIRYQNDTSLKLELDAFIEKYKSDNKVSQYKDFISKTLPNSRPADTVNFLKNYKERWPKIKSMVYSVAEKSNINPIFLGAISYQESHWNEKAVSPTQVKGLMMLTKVVAQEQGVTDRFDPLQSLEAGSQYFLKMKNKIPARIQDPDRTNFALAAYNIGFRNLEKARILTQKAGKDPDEWSQVKLFLPELNGMKGKKIDGKTAVRYVENIHIYQNLLQWKEQQPKNSI